MLVERSPQIPKMALVAEERMSAEHHLITAVLRHALKDALCRGQSEAAQRQREDALAFWRNAGGYLAFWCELLGIDVQYIQSLAWQAIERRGNGAARTSVDY